MVVSCTWMKICRTSNPVRVAWSRSPQLHMLTACDMLGKGATATSVMHHGLPCVPGLPLLSLPALKLWLSSARKKSYQAEEVVCTDSGALRAPTNYTSDTAISQSFEPNSLWLFLALPHAGPSGLSFID